jgi:hypothetical protein
MFHSIFIYAIGLLVALGTTLSNADAGTGREGPAPRLSPARVWSAMGAVPVGRSAPTLRIRPGPTLPRLAPSAWLQADAGGSTQNTRDRLIEGVKGKDGAGGAADLAKTSQNPVGDLISVPFQNNTNFGIGPFERTQNILNIQPVVPISISRKWNLISRTIIPLINQPHFESNDGTTFGVGDINPTLFLTPKKPGKIIWGVGPTVFLPTATDQRLGTGKWSAGPSFVVLAMPGKFVLGVLASNFWSFAGSSGRPEVNSFFSQVFVNYNLPKGWFLSSAPIITANWEAASGEQWTVPVGGGIGRVTKFGKQPVSITAQAYYNAVRPTGSAEWQLRLQFALLFPKKN